MQKTAQIIHNFIKKIGDITSWATFILMLVILLQVVLRYGFGEGMVYLEELQWHLYAVIIMIGFSYSHVKETHVRVDVISSNFSQKTRMYIELFGLIILLIPFLIIVFDHGYEFFLDSFRNGEKSPSPGGLPMRWLVKLLIPVSMGLIMISSFGKILELIVGIKGEKSGN